MKRKFTFLIAAAVMLLTMMATTGRVWGQKTDPVTVSYGWEDGDDASKWTITEAIARTASQGTGSPASYAGKINTNHTYVQFNTKVYVTSFSFYFKRTSNNSNYNVYIETSTDGTTWTAAETYTMGSFNNGSYTQKTKTFDGSTQYYVRFHCYNTTAVRYVDDVSITYNTEYTPTCITPTLPASGIFAGTKEISITTTTENANIYYTTDGSTPTASSTPYTTPFTITETTTIKAIAIKEGYVNSGVGTATYTKVTPYTSIEALFSASTSTSTPVAVTFDNWVITGTNSTNGAAGSKAYLSDGTSYGCVIYVDNNGFKIGDVLNGTVICNLLKYTTYGYIELENLTTQTSGLTVTTGGTVTPTVSTINALLAQNVGIVVTLNNVTCHVVNASNKYFTDANDNVITLSTFMHSPTLTDGKVYNITGVFDLAYATNNSNKRIIPRSAADVVESVTPTITVSPASVNVAAAGGDKHFTATYTAIETSTGLDILWYESDGTTPTTYNWVVADFDNDNNIDAVVDANTGEARTAYFKVYGLDSQANDVYSNLVTISQDEYVELFTVDFELGGGTFVPNSDFEENNVEKPAGTYNLPSATRPGYSFDGWNDGTTTYEADDEYTVSDDVTFTAQWTEMTTGTINFGSADGSTKIDGISVTGYDNMGYKWTITTVTTSPSFTQSTYYSQVGSSSKPATSITFTTTLASSVTITSFSAKFGGFADTAGDIVLKVGETTVGSGSLNGTSDVVVENSSMAAGTVLTVTVTNIAKGVKCYYITYTINNSTDPLITVNTTSLTGFTYIEGNGPSEPQTISVAGAFLEDDITVALPVSSNYEIKLTEGDWTNSLTLERSNGTVSATTINVRLKAGLLANNYNESITLSSGEVSETVTLSGTVTPAAVMTTYNLVTSITNGKHYIIVAEDAGDFYALGSQNGDYRNPIEITATSTTAIISSYDGVTEIVINGNTTDDYTLHADGFLNGGNKILKNAGSAGSKWKITFNENNAVIKYGDSDYSIQFNSNRFNCYSSSQTPVYLYEKEDDIDLEFYGNVNYNAAVIPDGTTLTVVEGSMLTVPDNFENNEPTALIIENGGQLIVNNAGVQATYKKSVSHTAAKTDPAENWYTIASPVNNIAPGLVTNLIQATATNYDLYYYDEVNQMWKNHKANAFANLTNGKGYLYWNSTGAELAFPGELNSSNVNVDVTVTGTGGPAGFNLIGNPYSHNIYKGAAGCAILNSQSKAQLAAGFYRLSNDGSWDATLDIINDGIAIKPGEGILVKATTAGVVTITNTASAPSSKANNEFIKFMVSNSQYEDAAYALFNDEAGLDKIDHRNANIPMLYIPQNNQNYAIATMSDNTEMFGLNVKAMTTGKYTLKAKANGNFSYLHIIDRLTGDDVDMLLEGEYSFIASPQDTDARFIVKLRYNANGNISSGDIFAYQNGSDIVVNGEGELQVFDVMGRLIATQHINGVQTVNVNANGVYIFKLNDKVQKIVVR